MNQTPSNAIQRLQAAFARAMEIRPKVGGFPVLAEVLRQTGVRRNVWNLPSCEAIYIMDQASIVNVGTPLASGFAEIPAFDRDALIRALRTDQAGESTFPEFLLASWKAGVVRYEVDFEAHTVTYSGCKGETYVESYPAVKV